MKKYTYILLFLVLCVFLSSCGGTDAEMGADSPAVLRIAGGATSGGYYLQSTPVASIWETVDQVAITKVESTIGAYENLYLLDSGEADAGLADLYASYCAQNGLAPFQTKMDGFKILAYSSPVTVHLIVREQSDIYSVSDLKGHSLATGTPGSATEAEIKAILAALGVGYSDLTRVDCVGVGASLTELQDGKVDAVAAMLMYPNSSVVETMLNTDIRLISISEEELSTLLATTPWVEQVVIPGNTYQGISEPVTTVSVPCALWVRDELTEELVYELTKALYENISQLAETNIAFNDWALTPSDLEDPLLHEGAKRFYQEVVAG